MHVEEQAGLKEQFRLGRVRRYALGQDTTDRGLHWEKMRLFNVQDGVLRLTAYVGVQA